MELFSFKLTELLSKRLLYSFELFSSITCFTINESLFRKRFLDTLL